MRLMALLTALTASASASEGRAATLTTRYSVSYLGAQVSEMTMVNSIVSSAYEASLDARSRGVANAVRSFRLVMQSRGVLRNTVLEPSSFSSRQSGTEGRTVRISFNGGDAQTAEIDPPFKTNEPVVPVSEEHKRQVVDPLSALIISLSSDNRAMQSSICNRTLRVFVGLHEPISNSSITRRNNSNPRPIPARSWYAQFVSNLSPAIVRIRE